MKNCMLFCKKKIKEKFSRYKRRKKGFFRPVLVLSDKKIRKRLAVCLRNQHKYWDQREQEQICLSTCKTNYSLKM